MATAEELRRLREEQSIFSALYDMARQQRSELAAEGRRPVLGGLLSKEPVYGTDTLRYEGIGDMLAGLLTPVAKAVDAPISAMRGTIPQEDMISEALGTAGLAMTGGGVAASTLGPKKPSLPSAPKERGDMILNMLKEGEAANITDDMFDMGDSVKTTQLNQYLFENYDLPMDAESRAQRLFQMGYRREGMHGTSKETAGTTETPDILAFRPSTAGAYGRGVYVDPVRDGDIGVSRYYAEPRGREAGTSGTYYPLLTKGKLMERGSYDDIFLQAMEDLGEGSAVTRDAADRLAEQRLSEQGFAGVGGAGEYTIFDPANIRSRSARADPRLAHLSNIMAANASKPVGLLVLEQQARGNQALGDLFKNSGIDINTATTQQIQSILDQAERRGILDPRSAFNLKRGLLD